MTDWQFATPIPPRRAGEHRHAFDAGYDPAIDAWLCRCGALGLRTGTVIEPNARWSDATPCTAFRGGRGDVPPSLCITCGWSAAKHLEAQLGDRVRSGRELLTV